MDAVLAAALNDDGGQIPVPLRGPIPDVLRERAREAAESGGTVALTIRSLGGWLRKPLRHTPDFLESLAATSEHKPIMGRRHEGSPGPPPPAEGVILAGRASDGELEHDVSIFGRQALEEMAQGIVPQWSINPQMTFETTATCSACGEPAGIRHAITTGHWPGNTLDGERVEVIFGGRGELAEITRTYYPAADGTGITAALTDDVGTVESWFASLDAEKRAILAHEEDASMADEHGKAPPEKAAEVVDIEVQRLRAELDGLKTTLVAEREQHESQLTEIREGLAAESRARVLADSRQIILTAAREGKVGPTKDMDDTTPWVDRLAALRADYPEAIDIMLAHTRPNPAFAVGRLSGAPPTPPEDGEEVEDFASLRDKVQRIARETGREYEDVWLEQRNAGGRS